jgi:hypothetical protein
MTIYIKKIKFKIKINTNHKNKILKKINHNLIKK